MKYKFLMVLIVGLSLHSLDISGSWSSSSSMFGRKSTTPNASALKSTSSQSRNSGKNGSSKLVDDPESGYFDQQPVPLSPKRPPSPRGVRELIDEPEVNPVVQKAIKRINGMVGEFLKNDPSQGKNVFVVRDMKKKMVVNFGKELGLDHNDIKYIQDRLDESPDFDFGVGQDNSMSYISKVAVWAKEFVRWCLDVLQGKNKSGRQGVSEFDLSGKGVPVNRGLPLTPQSSRSFMSIDGDGLDILGTPAEQQEPFSPNEPAAAISQSVPLKRELSAKLPSMERDALESSASSPFNSQENSGFAESSSISSLVQNPPLMRPLPKDFLSQINNRSGNKSKSLPSDGESVDSPGNESPASEPHSEQRTKLAELKQIMKVMGIKSKDHPMYLKRKLDIFGDASLSDSDNEFVFQDSPEEPSSVPIAQQPSARPPLGSLFGTGVPTLRKTNAVPSSESEVFTSNEQESVSENLQNYQFKTTQEYYQALGKVGKAAREVVEGPIRLIASKEFDSLWPDMSNKYKSDRERVNRPYDDASIQQFKKLQKIKHLDEFVDIPENKANIQKAVNEAEATFKDKVKRAKNLNAKASQEAGVQPAVKIKVETADTVRSKAEINIRDSIIQQRVDNITSDPSWMKVFKEDYNVADSIRAKAEGGPQGNAGFEKALEAEKNRIRMELRGKLTGVDKLAIEEQVNNVVTEWEVEQAKTPQQKAQDLKLMEIRKAAEKKITEEMTKKFKEDFLLEYGQGKKSVFNLSSSEQDKFKLFRDKYLSDNQLLIQEAGTQAVASWNAEQLQLSFKTSPKEAARKADVNKSVKKQKANIRKDRLLALAAEQGIVPK